MKRIIVLLTLTIFTDVLPQSPGTLKWKFRESGTVSALRECPSIANDGTIYFTSSDMYRLFAVNSDGTKKWEFYTSATMYDRAPVIDEEGTIYLGAYGGTLFAIYPDGTTKWVMYNCGISTTVAIADDGTIYFGGHTSTSSSGRKLFAVNKDGTIKWIYETHGYMKSGSSPIIGYDGTIYIGTEEESKLHAINPDGSEKWSFDVGYYNGINCTPAIGDDGTIYFGSEDKFFAVDKYGNKKWSKNFSGREDNSSPVIDSDGTIYITVSSKLYALDKMGNEKWSYSVGDVGTSPIIGDDGIIYVGSQDKNIYALQSDGTLYWMYETGGKIYSSPTLSNDGTLYVGSEAYYSYLYAVNSSSKGLKDCQWPKIYYNVQNNSRLSAETSVIEANTLKDNAIHLYPNYPNPFNPSTSIAFKLKDSKHVTLNVYDILGKLVSTLLDKNMPAGHHDIEFNAGDLSSGVYFYQLLTDNCSAVKKMILNR